MRESEVRILPSQPILRGDMAKLGAPRKISDAQLRAVAELMRSGIHQSEACRRIGINIKTWTAYKSRKERGVGNENRTT